MFKLIPLFILPLVLVACQPLKPTTPPVTETQQDQAQPESPISHSFTASESGITAYDLLTQNAEVQTQDFGDAGLFIESINSLAGDAGHYWSFYLNGEYATAGVTQTTLETGDTIEFKYETIDPNQSNQ